MTKKTAWDWFSKYIRLRDAIKTTGTTEYGRCITCGAIKPIAELQAGHGIGGRANGILFDDEIVHAQCVNCNYYKKGNYENYVPLLIGLHGTEWYEQKLNKSKMPCTLDFRVESDKWRKKYKNLLNETIM